MNVANTALISMYFDMICRCRNKCKKKSPGKSESHKDNTRRIRKLCMSKNTAYAYTIYVYSLQNKHIFSSSYCSIFVWIQIHNSFFVVVSVDNRVQYFHSTLTNVNCSLSQPLF